MSTITEKKSQSKAKELLSKPYRLDLHNDDYNSFDHVINCLMNFCGHEYEQANQCAHVIHFKGKCDVKYGDYDTLSVMKEKLINAGLIATMESN